MNKVEWKQNKIEKAVNDFNNWQGKAVIMVDTSDGNVWTDIFVTDTDWNEYHSDTVHTLYAKDNFLGRDGKISAKAINDLLAVEAYKYDDYAEAPRGVLEILYNNGL